MFNYIENITKGYFFLIYKLFSIIQWLFINLIYNKMGKLNKDYLIYH